MTHEQLINHLIAGTRLRRIDWPAESFISANHRSFLVLSGTTLALEQLGQPEQWQLFEEDPNPYPQGSFQWAREETRRGRDVKRPDHCVVEARRFEAVAFPLASIDAMDWELAP